MSNISTYTQTDQEKDHVPPALIDSLTTFQTLNEQELTYLLICDPYGVLKLAGDYLPEVGKRERSFWQSIKKNLPPNLENEETIQFCLNLAFRNGYKTDFFKWQDRYMECLFSQAGYITLSDRTKQLLKEIIAAHDTRVSIEIVQRSSRFQRLGDFNGTRN